MAWVAVAAIGSIAAAAASGYSGWLQSEALKDAAETAKEGNEDAIAAQQAAQAQALAQQKESYGKIEEMLNPYIQTGNKAWQAQQDLAGMSGPEAQRAAIDALQNNPEFASMVQSGETALLQNASATGGVRGGNTQGALAQFRPQMLSNLIQDQYNRLGGFAGVGYDAQSKLAQAQGNVGNIGSQASLATGSNLWQLFQQGGKDQAGYQQQMGGTFANTFLNPLYQGLGMYSGITNTFNPPTVAPNAPADMPGYTWQGFVPKPPVQAT